MAYRIESIELLVREMPPDRMLFSIGQIDEDGNAKAAKQRRPQAILIVRVIVSKDGGSAVEGCSGDRPSFGWLDKRSEWSAEEKLAKLLDLAEAARGIYLESGESFSSVFSLWRSASEAVAVQAKASDCEDLMGSYASALFERAIIDAVCRLEEAPFFEMVRSDRLGIRPEEVHPELKAVNFEEIFPATPRTTFSIRHTVGHSDPIDSVLHRVRDGEPETLKEYAERDGLRYFKIKISGDADADLRRLDAIWNRVLSRIEGVTITLDGNEAYTDISKFEEFVGRFEKELHGMFQHTLFIEQPMTRAVTLDPATAPVVRRIDAKKPLVIDEADGKTTAFREAFEIGYSGCSHKNCKGVFKSLLNWALCHHYEMSTDREIFLSGEDLSNMSIVPLHQDFAALGVLNISHCERNGHHYGFGLSHLTEAEKKLIAERHPDLYEQRGDEYFLRIRNGRVSTASVHGVAFGTRTLPEWDALVPLAEWRSKQNKG